MLNAEENEQDPYELHKKRLYHIFLMTFIIIALSLTFLTLGSHFMFAKFYLGLTNCNDDDSKCNLSLYWMKLYPFSVMFSRSIQILNSCLILIAFKIL